MANHGILTMLKTKGFKLTERGGRHKRIPGWIFGLPPMTSIARHEVHPIKLKLFFFRWWLANPNSFRFVVVNGVRFGFTCVLPLTNNAFDEYRTGSLSEWSIQDCHIHPLTNLDDSHPVNILIQSITLSDPPGSNAFLNARQRGFLSPWEKQLFTSLLYQIARISGYRPIERLKLIADGTREGANMLTKMGFEIVNPCGNDGRPIFLLDMTRMDLLRLPTLKRLQRWNKKVYQPYCCHAQKIFPIPDQRLFE